jgi:hypothetical protein
LIASAGIMNLTSLFSLSPALNHTQIAHDT